MEVRVTLLGADADCARRGVKTARPQSGATITCKAFLETVLRRVTPAWRVPGGENSCSVLRRLVARPPAPASFSFAAANLTSVEQVAEVKAMTGPGAQV